MEGTKTCGTCVVHMYAAKVSGMVDDDDGWSLVVEVVVVVVVVVFGLPSPRFLLLLVVLLGFIGATEELIGFSLICLGCQPSI